MAFVGFTGIKRKIFKAIEKLVCSLSTWIEPDSKSNLEYAHEQKLYSDDKGSAENGGDLGYFTKGQMVQPFEEAAFSLKPGEISGIVESQYGYHIIKVYDKIDEQLPFNDVKDEIKNILIEDKYVASIEDISKKAKVEKHENIVKKVNF